MATAFSPPTYGALIGLLKDTLAGAGALKGDKGDSAYQVWLARGNTGTVQDFLDSIIGDDGEAPEFREENRVLQMRYPSDPPGVWVDLYEFPGETTYEHTQNIAAAVWTIPHNLGQQFVAVRVNDFSGTEMIPEIEYTSANVVTLLFAAPRQGVAQIYK